MKCKYFTQSLRWIILYRAWYTLYSVMHKDVLIKSIIKYIFLEALFSFMKLLFNNYIFLYFFSHIDQSKEWGYPYHSIPRRICYLFDGWHYTYRLHNGHMSYTSQETEKNLIIEHNWFYQKSATKTWNFLHISSELIFEYHCIVK